ncbi:MAG: TonB-dependent receptor [Sphingomonas sp.]
MRRISLGVAALPLLALAGPLAAQTKSPRPAPAPTPAQTPSPADEEDDGAGPDIVVQGRTTPAGSVTGDIKPEQVLSQADIRSYGVSSLNDLLTELAPETQSGRGSGGAPVVLLNGKRISSFAEIRDIPTEAIARVDILPEEVALKYGYRADQRVVNVVLRNRFRALTAEGDEALSTEGGRSNPSGELNGLQIRGNGRVNLDLKYSASDALLESQRSLTSRSAGGVYDVRGNVTGVAGRPEIDPVLTAAAGGTPGNPVTIAGVPASAAGGAPTLGSFVPGAGNPNTSDLSPYRTLLPSSQTFSANIVYSRPIGKVSATINGRVQLDTTTADLGLPGVSLTLPAGNPFSPFSQAVTVNRFVEPIGALTQSTQTIASHLGAGLNGDFSPTWRWNLTANYDRTDNKTFTQTGLDTTAFQGRLDAGDPSLNVFGPLDPRLFGAAPDTLAFSTSNAFVADALINGQLLTLPAGPVNTALRLGAQATTFDSRSVRLGITQLGKVDRNIVNGQLNIDVPLTSRRTKFLDAIGDLSINGNIAVDHLSDFGTLYTVGYGANWSPTPTLRLLVTATNQDVAPTPQQLGNPQITTPNVRVFDYVTGQSVDITRIDGGNPALVSSSRHVFKAGGTFKPLAKTDLTFIANYIKTGTDNPIASFPADTPQIEAAFPGRFTRDANGQLTRVDGRPVNFLREDTEQLRYGFNISIALKSKIQKQFEAFRAGKGPNPMVGLREAFGNRGPDGRRAADGQQGQRGEAPPPGQADAAAPPGPPPTQPDGSGMSGGTPNPGRGGFGGGGFGGGGRGGGRGGGFGGRGGQAGGRLQFALYHTWHFVDRVTVANGIPSIDLLDGGATGTGGGQSRHEVQGQAGYSNNGIGLRLSANYQSATQVTGGTFAAPTTLDFGSLTKFDLRLFADLTQNIGFIKKHHWARGMRITLAVSNLFDARQRVTDQAGAVPLSYQGAYLDPLGRTVRLSIRKLFF